MSSGPVLQLSSAYGANLLYQQLFEALHARGVPQAVYAAVRTAGVAKSARSPSPGIECHVRHVLRPHHRLFFRKKVRDVLRDLASVYEPERARLTHAHFLYSDGAVALQLRQRYGVPFVTAVRDTDLNVFMRLRPDLRGLMHRVASAASALIFLSRPYRSQFLAQLPARLADSIAPRTHVVPNGLDAGWLAPVPPLVPRAHDRELRVLFVGQLSRRKNVVRLMEAVASIAAQRPVALTLVGGHGDQEDSVARLLATGRFPFVRMMGRIENVTRLRALYRAHDVLAVPSVRETFGLVYLEAMSQGIPVVHAAGQGIDGYFPAGTVAEPVNPRSTAAIARGIIALASRAPAQRERCIAHAAEFSWAAIAERYEGLYTRVAASSRSWRDWRRTSPPHSSSESHF